MVSSILVGVFLVAMIGIGIWGLRRTRTVNDFFLGGRSIGPWGSAIAYGTTYFSAVLFISLAGQRGWGFGLNCLWIAAGNALFGSLLAWLVLARRTRRMTENLDAMTMPEFFHERYNDRGLRLVAALMILLFLLPYCASVFKGLGHLFEVNSRIPGDVALCIMIGVTGIYLILGGYFAVVLADFIQGIIMLAGAIAMVFVLLGKAGGLEVVLRELPARYAQHLPAPSQPSLWLLGALVFMTSFGTWGLPQMVQKFYAIRDETVIVKTAIITTLFASVITFCAYLTGAMTHLFFDKLPLTAGKPDLDRLIPDLLSAQLPPSLMGLILLLVLAAAMSTLSSLVLVASSAVSVDLCKGYVNPNVSPRQSLRMMRLVNVFFILFALLIAKYDFAIIVTLMSLSWGVVAGAFMAPYFYGLYWRRTTRAGVWAGMFTGAALGVLLFFILGAANAPIAASVAILMPFIVVPIVSSFTQPPEPALLDKAFHGI